MSKIVPDDRHLKMGKIGSDYYFEGMRHFWAKNCKNIKISQNLFDGTHSKESEGQFRV